MAFPMQLLMSRRTWWRCLKDNAVRIVASNRIAGDPAVGKSKKLIIRYRLNQMTYYSEFLEGTEAVIPLRA